MILTETTFATMSHFIRCRCEAIPLDALLKAPEKNASSKPLFLLTFDDGWEDNYSTAYPWLKKLGIPAVIFISVGAVEKQEPFWIERIVGAWKDLSRSAYIKSHLPGLIGSKDRPLDLNEAVEALKHMSSASRHQILEALSLFNETGKREEDADKMLTWEQILEMSRDSIEFGSHTMTHPLLTYENEAAVKDELTLSKQILERKLNRTIRAFAYPNGDLNQAVKDQVREAGYDCAFVTDRKANFAKGERFAIRRVMLHEGNVTGPGGNFSPAMFALTLARFG
jgi:peptidoglycan/xylan/chitin deacetylase (PgdA/CDA1 family)